MTLPSIGAWLLINSITRFVEHLGGQTESDIRTTPSVVLGNPIFPEPLKLQALPGTAKEAQAIAKLLGVRPNLGVNATINALFTKGNKSRIMHIATHGVMIPEKTN